MPFFDCEFPRQIAFTSTGGSGFSTQVNAGFSGFEQTNRNWSQSRAQWQIVLTGKPQPFFDALHAFFLVVGGMADGFRFYWPIDCKGIGQFIGNGDGATRIFQLQKTYSVAGRSYVRIIKKPIMSTVQDFQGNFLQDTVKMFVAGQPRTLHVDYDVDATTGLVTLTNPPATGAIVTADFQYHYPVRFDVDSMKDVQIIDSNVVDGNALVSWSQLNLVEIRI